MKKPSIQPCQQNLFEVEAITPPPKANSKSDDSFVFDLMDALSAPILTFSMNWADSIPARLLDIIPIARMIALMKHEQQATYAECFAYIYTRTLEAPMDSEWTDIYLHVSCTVMENYFKQDTWDIVHAKRELSDWLRTKLNRLRSHLYEKRRDILKKQGRLQSVDETPKPKKDAKQQPPQEQPSLF